MKLRVIMEDQGSRLKLIRAINGVPLKLNANEISQEIELEYPIKDGELIYCLVTYTENDSYVYWATADKVQCESKYQQLLTHSDKTFEIQEVKFKQGA